MRLSVYPLLLAGATLALQAGAAPLRVVVVTSHQEVSTNAGNNAPAVAHMMHIAGGAGIVLPTVFPPPRKHRGPCAAMKDKMLSISAKIFGIPAVRPDHTVAIMHAEHLEGRPLSHPAFSAVPVDVNPTQLKEGEDVNLAATAAVEALPIWRNVPPTEPGHGPVRIKHFHEHMRGSFLRRIYFALHHLGPWEGRAVAFVFGCGIGVLLRMVWVLAVVMVRTVKSRAAPAPVALDEDAEEIIFEAPPQYAADDKTAVTDDKTASAN